MKCPMPKCKSEKSKIAKTWWSEDMTTKHRRRKCLGCGFIYETTPEQVNVLISNEVECNANDV